MDLAVSALQGLRGGGLQGLRRLTPDICGLRVRGHGPCSSAGCPVPETQCVLSEGACLGVPQLLGLGGTPEDTAVLTATKTTKTTKTWARWGSLEPKRLAASSGLPDFLA